MNRLLNVGLLCVMILGVLAASASANHFGIPHFPGGNNIPDELREDTDNDGVIDLNDNCPRVPNAGQENIDNDRFGDVCDRVNDNEANNIPRVPFNFPPPPDLDWDGVPNVQDNCVAVPNADQADIDGDDIGNVCDAQDDRDNDNDSVRDEIDNCPAVANVDQADADDDDIGDLCDNDNDQDGVDNDVDNCIFFPNANQVDADGDNQGDACDNDLNDGPQGDSDADGVQNAVDIFCPNTPAGAQVNEQGCSPAQLDRDGDGDLNGQDNCPEQANADQADADGDGIGDVCDGQPNQNNNQNNQPPQPQTDDLKVSDLKNKFDDFEDDYTFFNKEYQKALDDTDDNDLKKYKRKLKDLNEDLENLQEDVNDLRENIEDQNDRSKRPLVDRLDDLEDDITKLQKRIDETLNPRPSASTPAPSQASSFSLHKASAWYG
ncbi:MAG: thrombospondin type 3 repeat-containing protein, partial [Nanoarchaeota archaeon]